MIQNINFLYVTICGNMSTDELYNSSRIEQPKTQAQTKLIRPIKQFEPIIQTGP